MSATTIALAGYIGWTILLVIALIGYRSVIVMRGQKAANEFNPGGDDVTGLGYRLTRAQANCVESFPFVGGVLLLALATDQQALTDPLAMIMFAARLAQSCVHILSTSVIAVQIRLLFFVAQIAICLYWLTLFVF